MTEQISTRYGSEIVTGLIETIVSNREYLSEIDGAIGDGDHGINMSKGFAMCGDAIRGRELTLAQAFDAVSDALMEGIGGSMGPLYGSLFMGMAESVRERSVLDKQAFLAMLHGGLSELQDISSAGVGDKCLMDTLIPAVAAFEQDRRGTRARFHARAGGENRPRQPSGRAFARRTGRRRGILLPALDPIGGRGGTTTEYRCRLNALY